MNVQPTHLCRRDHRGWRGSFRFTDRAEACKAVVRERDAAIERLRNELRDRELREQMRQEAMERRARPMSPAARVFIIGSMLGGMVGWPPVRNR
jgi:hypothetical protein